VKGHVVPTRVLSGSGAPRAIDRCGRVDEIFRDG
jgi:hypothetical protein